MEKKIKAEFIITDLSKGLSISDVQRAALSLFSSPMRFPKESLKFMTIEEFILDKGEEDER
jgi:hypothetical protein